MVVRKKCTKSRSGLSPSYPCITIIYSRQHPASPPENSLSFFFWLVIFAYVNQALLRQAKHSFIKMGVHNFCNTFFASMICKRSFFSISKWFKNAIHNSISEAVEIKEVCNINIVKFLLSKCIQQPYINAYASRGQALPSSHWCGRSFCLCVAFIG